MNLIIEKKITTKYTKVMLSESLYSIALYIYINKNNVRDTLFLLGDNINYNAVKEKLNNYIIYDKKLAYPKNSIDLFFLKNRIFTGNYRSISLFINGEYDFYGSDHVSLSPLLFSYNLFLIEDGLSNYTVYRCKRNIKYYIKKILGIPVYEKGYDPKTKKIYLTQICKIPQELNGKYEIIDRNHFLNSLGFLLGGVFFTEISDFGDVQLLITQPLSEDNFMTEIEKIIIYKSMINQKLRLVIKAHPREKTEYKKYFPNAIIIESQVLAESLFISDSIKEVKTIFSSAVINYPFHRKVKVYIKGTKFNDSLLNNFGCIDEKFINY